MNTKLLRQRILDLAIQGKLVPQDPSDEPASILLEKIHAEKEKLVKEGKLKKKDIANDSVIFKGDDNRYYEKFNNGNTIECDKEIFECPSNWEWAKIKNILESIQYGVNQSAKTCGTYKMVRITDIQDNTVDWNNVPYVDIEDFEKYLLKENDLLFARTGATVGKSYLVSELPYKSVYASYLIRLRFFDCLPSYIKYFFESGYYWNQISQNAKGIGQPNVNGTVLSELLIPIPPIKEQARIIKKINFLFKLVSEIEQNKKDLDKLKELAKSKVLDLAIQGKLVEQDPNDEPTSVLLERIRAEKEQMVRDGKLKKRDIANDSIIYKGDDNCYYEKLNNLSEIKIETEVTLPQNWELCRLNTIALINPKNNIDDNMDVGFIPMDHIEQGYQTKYRFQTKKWKDIKKGYTHFAKNDIIVAKISPCFENRKSAILNVLPNMYGAGTTELYVIRVSNKYIYNKYILWLLKSNYFIKQGYNSYTGTVGQQRISKDLIPNLLIPLPSYNEQLRIVKCITNAKKLLDEI